MRLLAFFVSLPMLISCGGDMVGNEVSPIGKVGGVLVAECGRAQGVHYSGKESLVGAQVEGVCLSESEGYVKLERKIRINPYSTNLYRISFVCDKAALSRFSSKNSFKKFGIVFDGRLLASGVVGSPQGVGCEIGTFDSLDGVIDACTAISARLVLSDEGCYEPCKSAADTVCVNQGTVSY
ncbi:hypothetical protein [Stenotrophomonas acidaminiphila]|jgi:hypothetical protein|uniref:hypothetical protein n=1 Tax=Stenotrophomonas acidaminiphila TaxID=128780 RepID=UPI001FAF90E1|nr:hypothetical protein [Stenotrophomonas acidaminiphila]